MTYDEELLVYWIRERERIRILKDMEGLPPPWTKDQTLQNYRFCNVRREKDQVTEWVREHWPHGNVGLVALARMFNLPAHLELLIPKGTTWSSLALMEQRSKERRAEGHKLFNGAYLVTTCGVKMDKVEYVYQVAKEASVLDLTVCDSLSDAHRIITSVNGLGSFLAAQVVADLKNTYGHQLSTAPDWWTWAAPGPGSRRGLSRALGGRKVPEKQFLAELHALWQRTQNSIIPYVGPLCMQDFQNCLCEYDKYRRCEDGGRAKQRYPGSG